MSTERGAKNLVSPGGSTRRSAPVTEMHYDLREEINGMAKQDVKYNEFYDFDFDMEVDDMITLNGTSDAAVWRYPENITHCINPGCGLLFESRAGVINHYKVKHSNHVTLCSLCIKPISTKNIQRHLKNMHSNQLILEHEINGSDNNYGPDISATDTYMEKGSKQTQEGTSSPIIQQDQFGSNYSLLEPLRSTDIDDEADLITLGGCGVLTYWRIPKGQKNCPSGQCQFNSDSYSQLVEHYKSTHAEYAILCEICDKPICSRTRKHFARHFRRMHRKVTIPYGFGNEGSVWVKKPKKLPPIKLSSKIKGNKKATKSESKSKKRRCEHCGKILLRGSYHRHLVEVHNSERILCPLTGCAYTAKRVELVRRHWGIAHASLRFPDIRRHSAFIYKRSLENAEQCSPNNTEQTDVRQEVPELSTRQAEITTENNALTPPYQATGNGFLSELSDLVSDDESLFSEMNDSEIQSEANNNASSGIVSKQSTSDKISTARQISSELEKQNNEQGLTDVQVESMIQAVEGLHTPNAPLAPNIESDHTMSTSNADTNGKEQQTQMAEGQSVAPNHPEGLVQHAAMDTISRPTITIFVDDDEESIYSISSDDTDGEDANNATEPVAKKAHIQAFQVLRMWQEVAPPMEIPDDEDGECLEAESESTNNDELNNLPTTPGAAVILPAENLEDELWRMVQTMEDGSD